MELLYLDINCYQQSFDDQAQLKIYLETRACHEIFRRVETGAIDLAWSFMHDNEINICRFVDRREETFRLAKLSKLFIDPSKKIMDIAEKIVLQAGFSAKDAVHIACAISCKAKFLSCDGRLISRASRFHYGIEIINPLKYIN